MPVNGLKYRQQISHRVACGEYDKGRPTSRNYFCISTASRDDSGHYVRDKQLEAMLVAEGYGFMVGDLACVTRLPISFDSNMLTTIYHNYFAKYSAAGCLCNNYTFVEGGKDNVAQKRVYKVKDLGKGMTERVISEPAEWEDCPCPCADLDTDGNGGATKTCKATADMYFQIVGHEKIGTYCLYRTKSRISMSNIMSGLHDVIERFGVIAGLKFVLQVQMIKSRAHRFPTVTLGLDEGNDETRIINKALAYRPLESLGDGSTARRLVDARRQLITSMESVDFENASFRKLTDSKTPNAPVVEGEGRL